MAHISHSQGGTFKVRKTYTKNDWIMAMEIGETAIYLGAAEARELIMLLQKRIMEWEDEKEATSEQHA